MLQLNKFLFCFSYHLQSLLNTIINTLLNEHINTLLNEHINTLLNEHTNTLLTTRNNKPSYMYTVNKHISREMYNISKD